MLGLMAPRLIRRGCLVLYLSDSGGARCKRMKARGGPYVTDRDEKTDHVHDHVHVNVDVDVVVHVLVDPGLRLLGNLSLTTMSDDGDAHWGCGLGTSGTSSRRSHGWDYWPLLSESPLSSQWPEMRAIIGIVQLKKLAIAKSILLCYDVWARALTSD